MLPDPEDRDTEPAKWRGIALSCFVGAILLATAVYICYHAWSVVIGGH